MLVGSEPAFQAQQTNNICNFFVWAAERYTIIVEKCALLSPFVQFVTPLCYYTGHLELPCCCAFAFHVGRLKIVVFASINDTLWSIQKLLWPRYIRPTVWSDLWLLPLFTHHTTTRRPNVACLGFAYLVKLWEQQVDGHILIYSALAASLITRCLHGCFICDHLHIKCEVW